ncbi:MAG TPA: glycosyltransferase family 4 protein [Candidatus Binataceae bacterium]|nr:glycosyltransferase family 4 protein [Candidatus Binataceae bacterium]
MRVCFFASISDRVALPKSFYGQDIALLEESGHEVTVATNLADIPRRCDLVMAWWFGSGVRAVLGAQLMRRPCFLMGNLDSELDGARPKYQRILIRYGVRHATAVGVLSQTDYDSVHRLRPHNLFLVHLGLEVDSRVARRSEREPIVLCVGTVGIDPGARKRLDSLLKAIALVSKDQPRLRFHFIGSPGPGYERFIQTARNLQVADRISLRGRVSFETRDELYRRALMLVHPVRYENLAVAQLEAMSHGLPVITTRCPLTLEIAQDAAQYCDPAQAGEIAQQLNALATDPQLWERQSIKGRQRVAESYSRARRRARLGEIIDLVMAGRLPVKLGRQIA